MSQILKRHSMVSAWSWFSKAAWRAHYFDPPRSVLAKNPLWKYGFLSVPLLVLAFSWPDDSVGSILAITLILNHLSTCFYFGPRWTFPFRLFSAVFLLVGGVFILFTLSSSLGK